MESTDLKTVKDHPAAVLRAAADQAVSKIPALPEEKAEARALHVAAATLETFERENNVTFAALSNKALTEVREAYEEMADVRASDASGIDGYRATMRLISAVNDLLGLDNQ